MGLREDRLIGFQAIQKINMGNTVTYHAASYLQNKIPGTDDALVTWTKDDEPTLKETTVEDIKELTSTTNHIIELEVETRMEKFLENYNDPSALTRGLQEFNVAQRDVDRDMGEIKLHKSSVKSVNALVNDFKGLKDNGELLSLYKEDVALEINADVHLTEEERILLAYQDVLNAIALELQGMCSYDGSPKYPGFDMRLELTQSRLRVASKLIGQSSISTNQDAKNFYKEHQNLSTSIKDAKTIYDLEAIGVNLNLKVPQLPLFRRWWNFN